MLKKFIIFLSIATILAGLRLYDNGLLSIRQEGIFTVYGKGGAETRFENNERPLLDRFGGYTRLDTTGGIEEAKRGLKDVGAKILWTEELDGITVIYAFSPLISKSETVKGKKVNVMIAVRDGKIAYGCPLLKGSY